MSNKKNRKQRDDSVQSSRDKGKKGRKQQQSSSQQFAQLDQTIPKAPPKARDVGPLVAKNSRQKELIRCASAFDITFAYGPAGTGKTYVPAGMACDLLRSGQLDRLIITRPIKTVDEELGFTTGDLDEKFAVHLEPYWDVFFERLGERLTHYMIEQGRIVAAPLGYMRGRTFKRCWVIMDEAQNSTKNQMKMFLTRIGEGSKFFISGDLTQVDLDRSVTSGLHDAIKRFGGNKNMGVVKFLAEDSVRHGLLKEIIEAYET